MSAGSSPVSPPPVQPPPVQAPPANDAALAKACGPCGCPLWAAASMLLRVALGSLMLLSGYMKLGGPAFTLGELHVAPLQPFDFMASIRAFKLGLPEGLVAFLGHVIPWTELLAGLFVLIGLWTRSAALLVATLMVVFAGGITSLLLRGYTDVKCPCFGALGLFCGDRPMGVCHLIRNTGFFTAAAVLMYMGHGRFGIDGLARNGKNACRT